MDGPWIGNPLLKNHCADEAQCHRDMIKAESNEGDDNGVVMIAAKHCAAFGV